MPVITELTCNQARAYFLQSASYTNIDLPKYFNFDAILSKLSQSIGQHALSELCCDYNDGDGKAKRHNPKNFEDVNYKLLGSKDGEYAWRPYELINPAIYVALVHQLTTAENWRKLLDRFNDFKNTSVICESLPRISEDNESLKAHQIKHWWTGVEQKSLELSLQYQYVFDADITDCYGSIYTHSIAWAMHGKKVAKEERKNKRLLGNVIDGHIQMMRYGQTNGIPQGSVLMDFIAEIVLGYVDILLTEKVSVQGDYKIVRYRDDYRVFTNNPEDGRRIIKCLSEVLSSLGQKLNTSKTR